MTSERTAREVRERPLEGGGPARGEYLTFRLGSEEYALDILKVQEIRNYETVTAIANAPGYVKGVVNLRGTIVPIVDLRVLLGMPNAAYTAFTVVIVLNLGKRTIGVVVDAVSDVIELSSEQIRAAPDFSGAVDTRYVLGLGTIDNRMLILADIERLLDGDEDAIDETAAAARRRHTDIAVSA